MVIKKIDITDNVKNLYHINTKTKEKTTEIPQLHLSFED